MLDRDINQLIDCYTQVLRHTRARKPLENPTVIAFDTEYDKDGLISLCFCVKTNLYPPFKSKLIYSDTAKITIQDLEKHIMNFAEAQAGETIYVLSHFAQAEIQHIKDLWKQLKIRVYQKSMYANYDGTVKLRFIDTFAHFMCGLEKVARSAGMKKISLEGIGGKTEKYWKDNMRQLCREHREIFERYAVEDVKVLIEAFHQKREFFKENFGIDILTTVTLAHTAQKVFTKDFLTEPVEPWKEEWKSSQQNVNGKWTTHWQKTIMYDGSRDKRYYAMKCYWGGRREAFIRGYLEEPVEIWDVKQMYPTMAQLPLPNQTTKWTYLPSNRNSLQKIERGEGIGFVHCHFEFPKGFEYPCLPVFDSQFPKLVFPLTGDTWCTSYEVELALRLGAELTDVSAWIFEPTETEWNHPLKKYMQYFNRMKNSNPEGTVPYENAKLLMNSLIGKFCQRDSEYSVESYQNMLEDLEFDYGKFQQVLKNVELRRKYRNPISVGSCWEPEWSALILGSARAIISEIMYATKALTGHTDSVIIRKDSKTDCQAVQRLRELGSDLEHKQKYDADSFWICRSAVYSPILKLVKIANKPTHHGYPCNSHEEFGNIIKENLTAGKPVLNETHKTHLTTPKEALRQKAKLNTQTLRTTQINWDWDFKRKLCKEVNIWKDWTPTEPWKSLKELLHADGRKQGKILKREYPVQEWQRLRLKGWSNRRIAREYKVSRMTVNRQLAQIGYIEIVQKEPLEVTKLSGSS